MGNTQPTEQTVENDVEQTQMLESLISCSTRREMENEENLDLCENNQQYEPVKIPEHPLDPNLKSIVNAGCALQTTEAGLNMLPLTTFHLFLLEV